MKRHLVVWVALILVTLMAVMMLVDSQEVKAITTTSRSVVFIVPNYTAEAILDQWLFQHPDAEISAMSQSQNTGNVVTITIIYKSAFDDSIPGGDSIS